MGLLTGGFAFSQSDYTKYEKENMEPFRVAYDFEYPAFPEREDGGSTSNISWTNPDPDGGPEKGEVEYKMDPGVHRLVNLHKEEWRNQGMADGFRVQLFAGSNLGTANKIKSDFNMEFEDHEAYLDWEQPTFRVRVGDFMTRPEAVIFCNELKLKFPGAFVVTDKVNRPELRKPKFDDMIENPDSLPVENRLPDGDY